MCGRTVLIIAHRLSTVRDAAKVMYYLIVNNQYDHLMYFSFLAVVFKLMFKIPHNAMYT